MRSLRHPRNTPGRKNDRRKRACERLERQLADNTRRNDGQVHSLTADERAAIRVQLDTLTLRIMPDAEARAIRTKKDRSGKVRFSRAQATA